MEREKERRAKWQRRTLAREEAVVPTYPGTMTKKDAKKEDKAEASPDAEDEEEEEEVDDKTALAKQEAKFELFESSHQADLFTRTPAPRPSWPRQLSENR